MTTNMIFSSVQTPVIHGKFCLNEADELADLTPHCILPPSPCTCRFRVWFHFSVQNVRSEQVKCLFHYPPVTDYELAYNFHFVNSVSSSMW